MAWSNFASSLWKVKRKNQKKKSCKLIILFLTVKFNVVQWRQRVWFTFKVVPYSVWRSKFVLTILAVWQIGGHSYSAVWKAMPTFLSIGQIVMELELPPLNMNTKQFSLYGTTLSLITPHDTFMTFEQNSMKMLLISNVHIKNMPFACVLYRVTICCFTCVLIGYLFCL